MSLDRLNYELINDELMTNQVWTQSCLSPELRLWHHPMTAPDGGTFRISGLRCSFLPLSDYANWYICSSHYLFTVAQPVFAGSAEMNLSEFLPPKQLFFARVSQIPSAIWWNLSLCSRNSVFNAWSKTHGKKYIEMHWPNDWKSDPLSSSPSSLGCVRAELSGRFISSHHIEVFVSIIFLVAL